MIMFANLICLSVFLSVPPRGISLSEVCLNRLAYVHISGVNLLPKHCTCALYLFFAMTF